VIKSKALKIRTYERGVFHETLACGTGATASAGVAHLGKVKNNLIEVVTHGGKIEIEVTENDLYMTGPAVRIFDGVIDLDGGLDSGI
jgi:diaminopimelate epimerase